MSNYIGNVHSIFFEVLKKKDGFNVGEKLTQMEKSAKKRFINMTDQELYEIMESYANEPIEQDEKLTDEEFVGWINLKTLDGEDVRVFAGNATFLKE
jgi:translation elongation factor EF-G